MELMKFTLCILLVLATTMMMTTTATSLESPLEGAAHRIARRQSHKCPAGKIFINGECRSIYAAFFTTRKK